MPTVPKLLSLALVFLTCLTPLVDSAQRTLILGLLGVLAALDAGAAVRTTVVAMEQVAGFVVELLSVRVLPFYLALSALAWVGLPPESGSRRSASAHGQACASPAAGAMCGAEGRGGCGSSGGGCGSGSSKAGGSACGCSAKAAVPQAAPRPLNHVQMPSASRVILPPTAVTTPKPPAATSSPASAPSPVTTEEPPLPETKTLPIPPAAQPATLPPATAKPITPPDKKEAAPPSITLPEAPKPKD